MKRLYDLSHEFNEDTFHPYGFPRFENIQMFSSHGCRHAKVSMSLHFATHIDAPWHMVRDGRRLDAIGINELAGEAVIVDISGTYGPDKTAGASIASADIAQALERGREELAPGDALAIYTGWAELFASQPSRYYGQYCTLSSESCRWLMDKGVRLVCIDAPDVDLPSSYRDLPFSPTNHHLLLGNGVLVLENLGGEVRELLGKRVVLIPAPLRIAGEYASGAPVRLLAMELG